MTIALITYCIKCKAKRELADPKPVFTSTGRAATRGSCPVCGSKLFRFGRTQLHQGLPQPKERKTKPKSSQKAKGRSKLVIVESPAKAQTLGRLLGREYAVRASLGHVRDLLRSRLSVDVDNGFLPTYRVPNEKRKVVKALSQAAKQASEVYLATDPDREGEAIAWHLLEAMAIGSRPHHRVAFHEVTKGAVQEAFARPRDIDMDLVNAQQARRILDRLVGYSLGPLLWKNVKSGLSAGRVQSVALRLVVEREREIEAFVPREYWTIQAELAKLGAPEGRSFQAQLVRIDGEEFELKTEAETQNLMEALEGGCFQVSRLRRRDRVRNPRPPFTTSTLQQEASRRLGFSPARTMRLAQQLYEGISLGPEGRAGLITYMRTDAVGVSAQAQRAGRSYIEESFGKKYLPPKPRYYRQRAKHAQEGHEAIRPTMVRRDPTQLRAHLTRPQWRLYQLIWTRFVASQMASAIFDTISLDIQAGAGGNWPYLFRAAGSLLKFPGYLLVYQRELGQEREENPEVYVLHELTEREPLRLLQLIPEQHFTQPPPRYTEASLVRALEEKGIGRPSTYAPTLSTLQRRAYVEIDRRRLHATELGCIVNDLLVAHFPDVLDIGFTARMEENLDGIAAGEYEWTEVMEEFYAPFAERLAQAQERMQRVEFKPQYTGELCELCGSPMVVRDGRYGKFIACRNYPGCRNTKPFALKVGASCPECGGEMEEKVSRRGRTFYGCSNYPQCRFVTRRKPFAVPCPRCGGLLVENGRGGGRCLSCRQRVARKELEAELERH